MAEIKEGPLSALALVMRHNCRFHPAAHRDCMLARRTAGKDLPPIRLQPGEEARISYQPVFDDFGITGPELARRQRVEQSGICNHQQRLVERADEVFAVFRIDCGLSANRRIDLRQQRRGNLHIAKTTTDEGRSKTSKISDDTTAESHDKVGALDACGN